MKSSLVALALVVGVVLPACGDDDGSADASMDARDSSTACSTDEDCDDGIFCNGTESCGTEGCAAGDASCSGMFCDEEGERCVTCEVPDTDGDGVDSVACGGSDCDDEDPTTFPGNV